MGDLAVVKGSMRTLFDFKTANLYQLPAILQGLACFDEDRARKIGNKIIELIAQDPRREAHEDLTWKFIRPDSKFKQEFDLFMSGRPRRECSRAFRYQLACWRFGSAVETAIEARHARTTMANRRHHIGPVRFSLSNRLPLLEEKLRKDHIDTSALIECFEQARNWKRAMLSLGLQHHPVLKSMPRVRRKQLAQAIYHCTLEDL